MQISQMDTTFGMDIIDIHTNGGIVKTIIGRKKTLTFWIHLIFVDIQGNNNLVGANQSSGVWPCLTGHESVAG